jgi:hypothetical protein
MIESPTADCGTQRGGTSRLEDERGSGITVAFDEHVVESAETVRTTVGARHDEHGYVELACCCGEPGERAVTTSDHEAGVPARDELRCGERQQHGVGAVETPARVHVARHRQLERNVANHTRIRRDDDVVARLPRRGDRPLLDA